LTSDEIARELGNFKIVYGVHGPPGTKNPTAYTPSDGSGVDWHVGVIEESAGYGKSAAEGWRPTARFPEGRYDGVGYPAVIEKSGKQRRVRIIMEESLDEETDDVVDENAHLLPEGSV